MTTTKIDDSQPTIKVYSMDNCTWYAAESAKSAIAADAAREG